MVLLHNNLTQKANTHRQHLQRIQSLMLQGQSQPLSNSWRKFSLLAGYSVAVTFRISCALFQNICCEPGTEAGSQRGRTLSQTGKSGLCKRAGRPETQGLSFPPAQSNAIQPHHEANHWRPLVAAKPCWDVQHTVIECCSEPKISGSREKPSVLMAWKRALSNQIGLHVGLGAACWRE